LSRAGSIVAQSELPAARLQGQFQINADLMTLEDRAGLALKVPLSDLTLPDFLYFDR
jgi:hypothetical protein